MKERLVTIINDPKLVLVSCLLVGLAPFYPSPHVWGKLIWILGGAEKMEAMDYLDFLWHVWPFALLLRLISKSFLKKQV
jgi:hypothetical protein